jgi:hypothetical protein
MTSPLDDDEAWCEVSDSGLPPQAPGRARPASVSPDLERLIVAEHARGEGWSAIASKLNAQGVPTTYGRKALVPEHVAWDCLHGSGQSKRPPVRLERRRPPLLDSQDSWTAGGGGEHRREGFLDRGLVSG